MARNLDDRSYIRNRFGLIFTDYLRRRFSLNDNQERVQDVEEYQEQESFSQANENQQEQERYEDVVRLLISAGDSIDGLQQVTSDYATETSVS